MLMKKGIAFLWARCLKSKKKFPIKEIPITFLDREKGESKIPKFEIIRTLISLFKYVLKGI